jgi:hypothetical protein
MADFFSRLVERTLGLAVVVRPAVATLFAPGPQIAMEPQAVVHGPSEAAANNDTVSLPLAQMQPFPPAPETPQPRPVFSEPHTVAVPRSEPQAPLVRPDLPEAKRAIPVARIEPDVRHSDAGSPGPQSFDRPVDPTGELVTRAIKVAREEKPSQPAQPSSAAAPGPHFILPKIDSLPQPQIPLVRRSVEESRPPATAAVSVNIGRIEVRAVFPEAQPLPSAPPAVSSALSLSEYLKQRDGGMR